MQLTHARQVLRSAILEYAHIQLIEFFELKVYKGLYVDNEIVKIGDWVEIATSLDSSFYSNIGMRLDQVYEIIGYAENLNIWMVGRVYQFVRNESSGHADLCFVQDDEVWLPVECFSLVRKLTVYTLDSGGGKENWRVNTDVSKSLRGSSGCLEHPFPRPVVIVKKEIDATIDISTVTNSLARMQLRKKPGDTVRCIRDVELVSGKILSFKKSHYSVIISTGATLRLNEDELFPEDYVDNIHPIHCIFVEHRVSLCGPPLAIYASTLSMFYLRKT
jgi:hypothetical protein